MRILIISPHFPPTNAPDVHRVRLLIPHWITLGVELEVLAVDAAQVDFPADPWLSDGVPSEVQVHRVQAHKLAWRKIPGLGSLAIRSKRALARMGDALLAKAKFDLIYFSTTVFPIHTLGPRWKRKFAVPFIMDYQDPWVNDYYRNNPQQVPPGGRLKYGIMSYLHRKTEPRVLQECAGITAVSASYPEEIQRRYPWLAKLPALTQPFPADAQDLNRVQRDLLPQTIFHHTDGKLHWVYAGVVIPGMASALSAFFLALSSADPALLNTLKIHFIGTRYSSAGEQQSIVQPLAEAHGLSYLLDEHPTRIAYSTVLACLRDADALLVFGTNDIGYTASKIYPYILARKPLLAIFHELSSVIGILQEIGGGVAVPVASDDTEMEIASKITRQWLRDQQWQRTVPCEEADFEKYCAPAAAAQMLSFFKKCLCA